MIRVIAKMMLAAGRWVWRWTSMNSYLACIHCVGLVFYGLEEARRISVMRRCSLGPSPWSTDTHSLHCWQSKWPWIHRPVAVIITRFRRSRVSQLEAKSASRSYKCRAMKMRAKILRKCHFTEDARPLACQWFQESSKNHLTADFETWPIWQFDPASRLTSFPKEVLNFQRTLYLRIGWLVGLLPQFIISFLPTCCDSRSPLSTPAVSYVPPLFTLL